MYELVLVREIQESAQWHIDMAKCISYNIPQKLAITVCFIQEESSAGSLDETDCSGKFSR